MSVKLSFEGIPDFETSIRFFLSAPVFAALAGAAVVYEGERMLISRFTPATLAVTHLLTLGTLTMCMLGALWQILPVLAGIRLRPGRYVPRIIHHLIVVGAMSLATGFLGQLNPLIVLGGILQAGATVLFLWQLLPGFGLTSEHSPSALGIRISLLGLVATVTLGGILLIQLTWGLPLEFTALVDTHATWGLLGWVATLVFSVGFQVIPMFQVSPAFPRWLTLSAPVAVFILLLANTGVVVLPTWTASHAHSIISSMLFGLIAAFGISVYRVLLQRKRPTPDLGTHYWRIALVSLILACLLGAVSPILPDSGLRIYPLLMGAWLLLGFGVSAMYGMLYKIVPFLAWYHLQSMKFETNHRPPSMKELLDLRLANRQLMMHACSLIAVSIAIVHPAATRIAGVMLVVSAAVLYNCLRRTIRRYRAHAKCPLVTVAL